jgi:hypothetical protein
MFHIPAAIPHDVEKSRGDLIVQPFERWPVDPRNYSSFHISDPVIASIGLDHPNLQSASGVPPPLGLFLGTVDPVGMVHYLIWPKIEEQPDGPTRYHFNLEFVVPQTVHVSAPWTTNVLSGGSRALMYTVDDDRKDMPRLLTLRRDLSPQLQPLWSLRGTEDPTEPVSRRDRPALSKRYYVRSRAHSSHPRFLTRPSVILYSSPLHEGKAARTRSGGDNLGRNNRPCLHRLWQRTPNPHPGFRERSDSRLTIQAMAAHPADKIERSRTEHRSHHGH